MRVLSISPFHDSSLAIINNGKVELFLKEERLTRIKRDSFAYKSIFLAAEYVKNNNKKIDYCTIASPSEDMYCGYLTTHLEKLFNCPVLDYTMHHHLCHASLAFYNSGFEKSLVVVIDRNGSSIQNLMREVESVFVAEYPCNFTTLYKNFSLNNRGEDADQYYQSIISSSPEYEFSADSTLGIVKVYESATTLIGEKPLENGKTMGLAAYGKPQNFKNFFQQGIPQDNLFVHSKFTVADYPTVIYKEYINQFTNNVSQDNYQFYADYAYQVQTQTQEQSLNLIKKWVEKTGIQQVCVTGGYGLNVVANEYYIKNLPNVEFYFEPLADDSGNSIGSAMHVYRQKTQDSTINKLTDTCFHGIDQDFLINNGIDCTPADIAEFLSQQKIVAVYNSKAEAGPRALGNRSILFDARNKDAKQIINKIKKREWYRPFAAMVLEEDFNYYFETHNLKSASFMTVSFQVKDSNSIPGVCHVDGSCRVQTVSNKVPHIHAVLKEFKNKTTCSVLLNTSFNLAGEALVETVEDAISTYNNTDIDILWFPEKGIFISKI